MNNGQIGSILDFENVGRRSPPDIRPGVWQVDDPIGTTWGYTSDMRVSGPGPVIGKLADTVSKNGTYLLNLSPRADGTIPQEQQDTLLEIGRWMEVIGEAIYGTHNWVTFGEDGVGGEGGLRVRYTVKGDVLYAIMLGAWPGAEVVIPSLATGRDLGGAIKTVTLLGAEGRLAFTRDANGLKVKLPAAAPCEHGYTLRITGLKTNPPTWTESGNPPTP